MDSNTRNFTGVIGDYPDIHGSTNNGGDCEPKGEQIKSMLKLRVPTAPIARLDFFHRHTYKLTLSFFERRKAVVTI